MTRYVLLPAAIFAVVASAVLLFAAAREDASAGLTNAQNIAMDMDPSGNTATELGEVQNCARINNNNKLDADEDLVADTVAFDLTVTGIPETNPALGFGADILYDKGALTVVAVDVGFLFNVNKGSSLFNSSDPVPDTNVAVNSFSTGAIDTASELTSHETGTGVMARLGVQADDGANPAQYLIEFADQSGQPAAVVIDAASAEAIVPDTVTEGWIAVDMECGATPPPPPTPSPTPTPPPFVKGDLQCDGDVDSVDALMALRYIASLGVTQTQPCPQIGSSIARQIGGAGSNIFGDINCNGTVEAVDPLFILRHVASLSVSLPGGCSPIGQ